MARLPPATGMRVVMTKWGDRPHWEFAALYLGHDRFGDWLGIPAGSVFARPGATYTSPVPQVTLVPHPERLAVRAPQGRTGAGWLATFHCGASTPPPGRTAPIDLYVDLVAQTAWSGPTLRATDLDLDVVRGRTGRVWVDDEEEFAEHRTTLHYPDDLVADVVRLCESVHDAAATRTPPFDGSTSDSWLARLRALGDPR